MSKILVAYFSAGGVTARVARKLAAAAEADLFEIEPAQKYTSADLNWMDKTCRSTLEMQDRASRPAIASRVADMSRYETVFVGFPIWWYREPSIIDTFMESYDFTGIRVIPFATSGGSGLGDAPRNMQALAPGAAVANGRRLWANADEEELKEWLQEVL